MMQVLCNENILGHLHVKGLVILDIFQDVDRYQFILSRQQHYYLASKVLLIIVSNRLLSVQIYFSVRGSLKKDYYIWPVDLVQ